MMHKRKAQSSASSQSTLPLNLPGTDRRYAEGVDAAAETASAVFLGALKVEMGDEYFRAWASGLRLLGATDEEVVFGAENTLHMDRILDRVSPPRFAELWRAHDVKGRRARLEAVLTELAQPSARRAAPRFFAGRGTYRFDNYVVGHFNRVAFEVVRAMAQEPASHYRVAYLHGNYGVGKSHLLLAASQAEGAMYFGADRFRAAFVDSIRKQDALRFKEQLRNTRLLLLDDVHMLDGAKKTQTELYHAVVEVLTNGGRVIMTGESEPASLKAIDRRLVERLQAGVICSVGLPDFEDRAQLLDEFLSRHDFDKADSSLPHVVRDHLIAGSAGFTPRRLEGVIGNLMAHTVSVGQDLTFEAACSAIRTQSGAPEIVWTVDQIQKAICTYHRVDVEDLLGPCRARWIVRPRQQAMYFAKLLTARSLPFIGGRFGKRDHTTVINAVNRVRILVGKDAEFAAQMRDLEERFRRGHDAFEPVGH